jgi:hypothetical protein
MAADWTKDESRNKNYPGADPYLEWATGAGRTSYFRPGRQQKWLPVLVRLSGITAKEFAEGSQLPLPDRGSWTSSVKVPDFYTSAPPIPGQKESYCTALVTENFFKLLNDVKELKGAITQITIGLPIGLESLSPAMQEAASKTSGDKQP